MKSLGQITRYVSLTGITDGFSSTQIDLDLAVKQAVRVIDVNGVLTGVVGGSTAIISTSLTDDGSDVTTDLKPVYGMVHQSTSSRALESVANNGFLTGKLGRYLFVGNYLISLVEASAPEQGLKIDLEVFELTGDEFLAVIS
jgi:hypothetical protein